MRQRVPCLRPRRSLARCIARPAASAFGARKYSSTVNSITHDDRDPITIFSGIQPTGVPHLGNYLGAIHPWVCLQKALKDDDHMFISVVDLHALTSLASSDPASSSSLTKDTQVEPLRIAKRKLLARLLAVGLDPQKITLFYQSDVPEHAELHWILSCNAPVGSLMRMTQWKSKMLERYPNIKSEQDAAREAFLGATDEKRDNKGLRLGLFSYPVLQAADILLYRATHVPVGEDQIQHIEFARNEAIRFNARFGSTHLPPGAKIRQGEECLLPPNAFISPFRRVMSLADPTQKMSKSAPSEKARILLTDDADTIRRRFASALTDSVQGPITYDEKLRPGIANLVRILAHAREARVVKSSTQTQTETDMIDELVTQEISSLSLKAFKALVADEVEMLVAPIRAEYHHLMDGRDGKALDEIAAEGAAKARIVAQRTILDIRQVLEI